MKKQLRFLYRYFVSSHRWRKLFNRQFMLVLVATAVFLTALAWTAPRLADREVPRDIGRSVLNRALSMKVSSIVTQATPNPTEPAIRVSPTNTPFPAEFYTNADQTIGITLAGTLLVVIVVLGTLTLMPKKKE